MKITPNILSIPPYISTAWDTISSLYVKEEEGALRLIILLRNGLKIEIPHLNKETIGLIFDAHAQYTENRTAQLTQETSPISFTLPLKDEGDTLEVFAPPIQHNPEQSNLPPLPPKVLKKISAIASALGAESLANLPKAEAGCNCIYCQVMNAVRSETESEEEVTEEDLKFRDWEIRKTADKLYIVTNPIDLNEHYSVFLGEPIGCTCGDKNCEHIRAVLSTSI